MFRNFPFAGNCGVKCPHQTSQLSFNFQKCNVFAFLEILDNNRFETRTSNRRLVEHNLPVENSNANSKEQSLFSQLPKMCNAFTANFADRREKIKITRIWRLFQVRIILLHLMQRFYSNFANFADRREKIKIYLASAFVSIRWESSATIQSGFQCGGSTWSRAFSERGHSRIIAGREKPRLSMWKLFLPALDSKNNRNLGGVAFSASHFCGIQNSRTLSRSKMRDFFPHQGCSLKR